MIYLGNGLYSDSGSTLCHHGIKGQKWGVKHGPPYPLDYKTKRDAGIGRRYGMSKFISKQDNQYEESYQYVQNGKTMFMTPSKAVNIMAENNPEYISIPGREIGGNYSWDKAIDAGINDMNQNGQTNNCAKCASTAMLRRMGYDVQPGRSNYGALTDASSYWWDNAEQHTNLSMLDANDLLNSMPVGAAGTIAGHRDEGGGHILNWERTEDGVTFVDLQPVNGIFKNDINSVFDNEDFNKTKGCTVYRLDEATPNWDHMAEDGVFRVAKDGHSAIYGRQQDRFYEDLSYGTIPKNDGSNGFYDQTTFLNEIKGWERGIVSRKNGEQSGGY